MIGRIAGWGPAAFRLLAATLATAVVGWSAGFVWFLHITSQAAAPPPPHVDGVVALTGGPGRVELALRLLATGEAERLLVSGIGGNTDLPTLGRLAKMDLATLAPRITLGRYAASTRGNAVETAAWAAQNRIHSIIVVTATHHMPRAMAELRQALPEAQLFPLPTLQGSLGQAVALPPASLPSPAPPSEPTSAGQASVAQALVGQRPGAAEADRATAERTPSLRLQAEEYTRYLRQQAAEYTKFLLASAGLSPWFPHREATATPQAPNPVAPNIGKPIAAAGAVV